MKKCLWLFLLCPVLAVGQSAPVVPNWCAQQQNGLSQTAWQVFSLPNLSCIQLNPAWSTIDVGPTAPNFVWANYDPTNLTPYTGWSLGACTTSGGTSTCNILSGTWTIIQNATIIISGSAGCDGTYTAGTNGSTFVHITSGCTSASGGKLQIACGANLAQGAAPCKLVIMSAMTDAAGAQNNAAYPFSQAYANSSCPAWQTGVTYGFNSCVTHGGHFQHVVNIPALTAQCTDISFGSFCLWNDDGATNAFVQEAVVGPSFQGNANAPNVFVSGGAVFSVTSNNCQPSESSACLATDVATGFPVYWETPMQAALKTWCTGVDGSSNLGFLQHYNSVVPAGQLLALECGAPQGVEWFFAMEGFFEAKYSMNLSQTESLLVNYASNNLWSLIHTEWVALGSPSWGMLVPDGIYSGCPSDAACSLYSNLLATVSLQYPENSPGNYGVRTANITTYQTTGVVRGDWVGIFARYPNTKFHVLEPFSVSCPNVTAGGYNPSLCNPGTQAVTGDYRTILPFATQFISTGTAQPIFILFEDDVACTYDAGITITVNGGSYPPCVNAPYTLPMANAAKGIFANTTIPTGIAGSFTISGTPPPLYSARTDLLPQPYPLTIPCPAPSCTGGGTFSGAGFQFNPSDFPATQLVKITDDSTPATNHMGFTTNCDDSSEGNDFNTLSTRFVLCQHGNIQSVWSFNPATLQFAQTIGPLWSLANSFTGGQSFYSYTQPYALYHSHPCQAGISGCAQHDLTIFQADTSGIGNPPTPTVVVDLNTACGLPNYAGPAFEDGVTVSRDDQSFSFNVCNSGSCGQGSAGNVITGVWNRTNGCSYLNTSTWQVFNNGVLLGTAGGTPQNFVMHNARITQDGSLLRINKGTCTSCVSGQNWLLWTPFTTTIAANTDLNGCGHLVNGYSHIANKCQGPINLNGLGYYPFSSINTWTSLPAAYPASSDANEAHPNWSNDNPTDTNPFFVSFDWPGSFAANFAWDSELVGVSTDGSGKVYRFAHNYATPTPSAFVPINVSQDGKFLLLSTDWNQMLGCTNGTTLGCGPNQPNWQASHSYGSGALVTPLTGNSGHYSYRTIGGTSGSVQPSPWNQMLGNVSIDGLLTWTNAGSYRSDVFLVELNPSPAATTALAQPNDDDSSTGWQPACFFPSCNPGGIGTPTSVNQTFVNSSPSQDGNAMMMTETGTNYSNVMFHKSIGADNSATTFTGTYSVYIPSLTPYQVFGMDMYQYIPGVRLMWGSQCAVAGTTAGFWSFFDQGSGPDGTWHVSTVPCPLTSATWYTISMTVHRVPGDTSCSGGVPAEHYDSLTQNGTTYPLNITYCSETTAFANDTGMQFDISSNVTGGTLTAYVDLMSYTAKY